MITKLTDQKIKTIDDPLFDVNNAVMKKDLIIRSFFQLGVNIRSVSIDERGIFLFIDGNHLKQAEDSLPHIERFCIIASLVKYIKLMAYEGCRNGESIYKQKTVL